MSDLVFNDEALTKAVKAQRDTPAIYDAHKGLIQSQLANLAGLLGVDQSQPSIFPAVVAYALVDGALTSHNVGTLLATVPAFEAAYNVAKEAAEIRTSEYFHEHPEELAAIAAKLLRGEADGKLVD